MTARYRNFVFTLNNPAANVPNFDELIALLKEKCDYFVIGDEVGESGTPHWQGYCELKGQTSVKIVNKWAKWHTESRRGTSSQAADYCKKQKILIEHGRLSVPGKRNDIVALRKLAINEGMAAVVEQATSFQQIRLVETYMNYHSPARDPNVEVSVTWIWGQSGTGKSRLAYQMLDGHRYYVKDEGPWWTGYNGEEYVLLDDFRDSWMTHNQFIKLIDRYPMRVKVHGGLVQMRAIKFIFTSVFSVDQIYAGTPAEPRQQIARRVKNIIDLSSGEPPGGAISEVPTQYSEVGVIIGPTFEQNVSDVIDFYTD